MFVFLLNNSSLKSVLEKKNLGIWQNLKKHFYKVEK